MATLPTAFESYPVLTVSARPKRLHIGAWWELFFGHGPLWFRLLRWGQRN